MVFRFIWVCPLKVLPSATLLHANQGYCGEGGYYRENIYFCYALDMFGFTAKCNATYDLPISALTNPSLSAIESDV